MKKLFAYLTLFLTLQPTLGAFAAPVINPDQGGQVTNLLRNNQISQGKAGLTASSGGTLTLVSDSSAIVGTSAKFTPTTSGQTILSDLYTVPPGLVGGPCLLSVPYRSSESTNLITAEVLDGANVVQSLAVPFTRNSGSAQPLDVPFVCPSSVRFKFTSTGSASGLVFDNLHLGSETRLKEVTQASMYGTNTFPDTSGCDWNSSSSAFSDYPANSSCPLGVATGRLVASVTKTPTVEAPNAPAGTYEVLYVPGYIAAHAGTNCRYTVTDESNVGSTIQSFSTTTATNNHAVPLAGVFNYSTAASHTFKVRVASSDNSTNCALNNDGNQGQYIVKYYPTQSQTITQGSGQAAYWSGRLNGSLWAASSATYVDGTPSGSTTIQEVRNVNFGSVTQNGAAAGINFSVPKLGGYEVCFSTDFAASTGQIGYLQLLANGTDQLTEVVTYNDQFTPTGMQCGFLNATSFSNSVKVQLKAQAATLANFAGGALINFTIKQLDAGYAAVAYPGVVSSGSVSQQRIEWANLDPAAVVTSSSSAWIGGGSVGATGIHSYTISGFSSRPYCMCTVPTGAATLCSMETVPTTSNVTTHTRQVEAAADNDVSVDIVCIGPR